LLLTYPNDGKVGEVVTLARSFIIVLLHKVATVSRPRPIAFIPGLVPKGTLGTSALLHRLKEERQRSEIPHHLKMWIILDQFNVIMQAIISLTGAAGHRPSREHTGFL